MNENKLKIKLVKRKPHKIYITAIENDYHIDQLCSFLSKHKDKKLEITINKKKFKFDSTAGRKKFVDGFKYSFSLVENYIKEYVEETENEIDILNDELDLAYQKIKNYRHENQKCIVRNKIMNLKTVTWEDRIQELEDDREILKEEIERLRKK